jgi:hypothetical protein
LRLLNGARLDRKGQKTLFEVLDEGPEDSPVANLSDQARQYLAHLKIKDPDADPDVAALVWMHVLAVGCSPEYLSENADGVCRDWPRIPLPAGRKLLERSAELGRRVASLLDTEKEVPGVTAGKIGPLFRTVGVLGRVGGGALNAGAGDLAVTAGWGHVGDGGAIMPAKGRIVQREFDQREQEAIAATAGSLGLSLSQARGLLGAHTCDVCLNDAAYWQNVPAKVWECYVGGYQVIKKWLSYREQDVLGRALRSDEAREVTNMARRLACLVLIQPALDENYRAVKAAAWAWGTAGQ